MSYAIGIPPLFFLCVCVRACVRIIYYIANYADGAVHVI